MDKAKLASVLREHAEQIRNQEPHTPTTQDTYELVRVLARICEGKSLCQAFGAPGDWGYGTPIGNALAEAYGVRRGT